jgi:hypothetical protein
MHGNTVLHQQFVAKPLSRHSRPFDALAGGDLVLLASWQKVVGNWQYCHFRLAARSPRMGALVCSLD